MKKSNNRYCIAVILICSLCSGCASFADWKLQELEGLPEASAPVLKAKLNVDMTYYFNGNLRTEFNENATKTSKKVALETFQKSGFFSSVDTEMADPDLDIKINFQNHERGSSLLAFISGFTFMVIPASATNSFVMDAEVTHLKTGEIRKYHLEDSMGTYIQILLIFIMPFNWPGSVGEDILANMYHHMMVKMQEDGLLNKAQIMDVGIETASLDFFWQ